MEIIESWEDHNNNIYAVVKHSINDQQEFRVKEYEAMYLLDDELQSFGGSVGYWIADFDDLQSTEDFLLKGISLEDSNPEIWLEMVEV